MKMVVDRETKQQLTRIYDEIEFLISVAVEESSTRDTLLFLVYKNAHTYKMFNMHLV